MVNDMKQTEQSSVVTPCKGEVFLGIISVVLGLLLWAVIGISLVGAIYAVMIGLFLFFVHLQFVTHIRGSAVRLGSEQFPDIFKRVEKLSRQFGMKKVPDAYLMQSGGALNAFASRFVGRDFLVLYSDLVESCGDDSDALDFVIAHELGHLHRGHLKWRWIKAPALFMPFLGAAYSRACEFTCDRYGALACKEEKNRANALCILSAGARYAGALNRQSLVDQVYDVGSFLMLLGQRLSYHPPLACRILALSPSLSPSRKRGAFPGFAAGAVVFLVLAVTLFFVAVSGVGFIAMLHGAPSTVQRSGELGLEEKGLRQLYDKLQGAAGNAEQLEDIVKQMNENARKANDSHGLTEEEFAVPKAGEQGESGR